MTLPLFDVPPMSGRRPVVLGVDPSLTSTGLAGPDWTDALRNTLTGHERLEYIREEVLRRADGVDLVVIEGLSIRSTGSAVHQLAGLHTLLTHALWRRRIPTAVATPGQRIIYACGSANPAKDYPKPQRARVCKGMVRTAVAERYGVECGGRSKFDRADAFVLMAMGMHWLGHPLAPVPAGHARALKLVRWPQVVPAAAA